MSRVLRCLVVSGDVCLDVGVEWRLWGLVRGMIFRDWGSVGDGLLLDFGVEGLHGVHTFFCRGMDLVFLSGSRRVVGVESVGSWSVPVVDCEYRFVLELPRGSCGLGVGDTVTFLSTG